MIGYQTITLYTTKFMFMVHILYKIMSFIIIIIIINLKQNDVIPNYNDGDFRTYR
jgi:hypothetical protein